MHPLVFMYTKIVDSIRGAGPHALSAALLIASAIQYQQNAALQAKYDALLKDYIEAVRNIPVMPKSMTSKVNEYASQVKQ